MKGQTVIGIFDYGVDAQMAAQQLMSNGIPESKIDIAVRGAKDKSGSTANTANTTSNPAADRPNPTASKTANPNATAANKSDSDNDSNFFSNLFTDDNDRNKYAEVAQHGSIVTVHAESKDQAQRAAELLDKFGAIDVDERAEKYKSMPREKRAQWINSSIPVVQEEMKVGKREVETGGVRLRSRVIEKPVEEHLRLREEHVRVERNAVNRPASEKDLATFKQGDKEFIEHAEVPMVEKQARVVEEVNVGKQTSTREETIRDTVKKQDVEVDKIKPKNDHKTGPATK
ncbi:YsnF/AvaK domain-containing protein [Pontibacter pamirensis]|uniref:YsnF/AvaK domain-containing protein n=1 Tax=Pontibacter pamirensis TaxID=2562824 RepID=UPI00138A0621|nr:YsnF/AvaK domain-containing protein [Pontibacter pamirensis]